MLEKGKACFPPRGSPGAGCRACHLGLPRALGPALCDAHSVRFRVAVRRMPEAQQRVGGCFLSLMPQMKTLYLAYCANHPSAVSVLTEHRYVSRTSSQVGGWLCPGVPSRQLISVKCYLKHGAGVVCFSRMVSLIILQVSVWGGLMSG